MIAFDWTSVGFGLEIGALISALYFGGLGVGMRIALRSGSPIRALLASAALRMSALIGIGWLVVEQGGPWSLLGYAAAFLIVRFVVTAFARPGPARAAAQ
jgi:hypothetical protein